MDRIRSMRRIAVAGLALMVWAGMPQAMAAKMNPIVIDGSFSDWDAVPSHTDPVGDTHDTDHSLESDTPFPVNHPDVDLVEYKCTHDEENVYAYFRSMGVIGRTQEAADGKPGRYYVIVTIDVDNDDITGYPLHEGGYYPTTPGYDMNMEVEIFGGVFNTGHYLNHGCMNDADFLSAQADQALGLVDILPGTYDYYTQWVFWDEQPPFPEAIELPNNQGWIVWVVDKGPVYQGVIQIAVSEDGHEAEMIAPFRGFLREKSTGMPVMDLGRTIDLSFSLEASGELAPGQEWASDTAEPINGYMLENAWNTAEGEPEGEPEGDLEGESEGELEGEHEVEGEGEQPEGEDEGEGPHEGEHEGEAEGEPDGEPEGESEGEMTWKSEAVNRTVLYSGNWNELSGTITKPGASSVRLHFSEIDIETCCDLLTSSAMDYWQGTFEDAYSLVAEGDHITLFLSSDATTHGMLHIDRIDYMGRSTGSAIFSGPLFEGSAEGETPLEGEVIAEGEADGEREGESLVEGEGETNAPDPGPEAVVRDALRNSFAALDVNADGKLSLTEARTNFPTLSFGDFQAMDLNLDGYLSLVELGGEQAPTGCFVQPAQDKRQGELAGATPTGLAMALLMALRFKRRPR